MPPTERIELKLTLRRHGVSQKAVADVLEVHESTVSLWLKDEVSSPMLDKAIPAYIAGLERGIEIAKAKAA